ncbi:MAG: ATP-binding protein [Acidobacteriota bacterium]
MIQEAIATLREIGANRELASALIYAARVRFTSGDFDGALSAVQESITTAESIGTESTNAEAYELLAELEEARGDLAAALAALRRHQELASQVLNEANSRQLTQMEARYQAESQAREIQELKEQKALKDLEFEHQRNVRTALVIGFGLLLAVLALLFNRYRLRAQTQRMAEAVEHEKAVSASLRRVDRLKDDFLANTSHELRTPLFGIVGLAEALLDDDATPLPAEARKNLELILQSGNRLNALVADILDSAKLRRRELELTRSSVSLHSLVDVVLTLSRPLVDGRDIQLKNDVSAGTPPVLADADRIQQVLHNLIGNAIKFTESGEVRVRAEVTGDGLRIAVDDTGIGIPEEHLDKIFNSFEQADASIERSYGGTGLGLAISRQLVRLHGGELQVSSTPGEGTTFFFTLPLAEEGTPVADVDVSGDLSRIPAPALLAEDGDPADPERETPPGDRPNRGGPTHDGPDGDGPVILTIDDEPVNQQVLKNHLVHHGHRVVSASSGPEALDLMARESVDLVLLDIMMPRMSGYEVCRRIRAEHSREDLPVIFLSAKNRAADRVAGFEEGGNDYLAKPIAKPELLKRVDTQLELLRSHRTQAEELKILRGLLTICSGCKRIRDDERGWGPLEAFIDRHSEASFTHGLCPSCVTTLYPDIAIDVEDSR